MIRTGITAAGTWITDYTKIISHFPAEGACSSVLSETINNGGAPYNLLVNLCRLEAPFPLRAIGCIGRDVDGESILKDCYSHAIDATRLRIVPEAPTSFSDVMASQETGVRTCFNHAGANDYLGERDFDFRGDHSQIFFLGTLFFLSALDARDPRHGTKAAAVLSAARKQGMTTCIDIERVALPDSTFINGGRAALHETDLPICNVEVAELLSGVRIRYPFGVDVDAAAESAAKLLSMGNGKCAVIRFPTGAVALARDGTIAIEGSVHLPKSRIVSAAGCGHAFTAGFLSGYHDSQNLSFCLQSAHATAAACLTDRTTSGGIKKLRACLAMLHAFGQREIEGSREVAIPA